jgi:hypothetical protein
MRQVYVQFVLAGAVLAGAALDQAQQPAPLPTFEVASVKPNIGGPGKMQTDTRPGGVYVAVNTPLRLLIADAYIGNQLGAIFLILDQGFPESNSDVAALTAQRSFAAAARRFANVSSYAERTTSFATSA